MKMFFAVVFAVAFSGLAMAADREGGGGDGGSALVDRMIAANEAAMEREAQK